MANLTTPPGMLGRLKAGWKLLRDPATPKTTKLGILGIVAGFVLFMIGYGASPIDLIPELFTGPVGLIDDIIIIPFLFWLMTRIMPTRLAERVLRTMGKDAKRTKASES